MKTITSKELEAEVLQSAQPVLVDFFTDGRGPCRQLAPVLEDMAQEQAGRWKIVKVDAGAEPELAARFRINSVPTLLAFRGGECAAQRIGAAGKKELLAWLAGV